MLDNNIVVSEFELKSRYYVHFRTNTHGKSMNSLIYPGIDYKVPQLSFYKDGFGIKYPRKLICHQTKNKPKYIYLYILSE